MLLEALVQAELDERARRRLERQLRAARLGRFKAMADFEWDWPKHLHRPTVDRVFTLDFVAKGENVILVGNQGLGKTMLSKNLVHQAVLAGHSALFITASDLLLNLNSGTSRALKRRLRAYARPHLLAVNEIGYLAYDAHAADLLFQIISRRYEQRSIVVTTNLVFKDWHTVFPNPSCAVALVDRLTHHAGIIRLKGRATDTARPNSHRRSAARHRDRSGPLQSARRPDVHISAFLRDRRHRRRNGSGSRSSSPRSWRARTRA